MKNLLTYALLSTIFFASISLAQVNNGNSNGNNNGPTFSGSETTIGETYNSFTSESTNTFSTQSTSTYSANPSNSQNVTISNPDNITIKNVPNISGIPLTSANDTCMGSSSGTVAGPGIGLAFGTTWVDNNCKMLKNSRELWNMGMKSAAIALLCKDPDNRAALEITGYKCPIIK
jgi:hypothetical protein